MPTTDKIKPEDQDSRAAVLDGLEAEAEAPAPKTRAPRAKVGVPAIYGSIVAIMGEMENITPDKKGPEKLGGYSYISAGLLMLHLRKLLVKHKVMVVPRVLNHRVDITFAQPEPLTIKDEKGAEKVAWRGSVPSSRTLATVEIEYTFHSAIDGSSVIASGAAESADVGDKALSKAFTTAFKKAMSQTFLVTTDEHGDVDYGDIVEDLHVAEERAKLKDRGEQHREKARGGAVKPRAEKEQAEPAPVATDEEIAQAETARDNAADAAAEEKPWLMQADGTEGAPAKTPAEPTAAAEVEETTDGLAQAKKMLREAQIARKKNDPDFAPVQLDALGEKLTGKKRADWLKSARDIAKIAKALEAGEVA